MMSVLDNYILTQNNRGVAPKGAPFPRIGAALRLAGATPPHHRRPRAEAARGIRRAVEAQGLLRVLRLAV